MILFCGWIGSVCGYKVKMDFCCTAPSLRGGSERESYYIGRLLGDTHGHPLYEERKEI